MYPAKRELTLLYTPAYGHHPYSVEAFTIPNGASVWEITAHSLAHLQELLKGKLPDVVVPREESWWTAQPAYETDSKYPQNTWGTFGWAGHKQSVMHYVEKRSLVPPPVQRVAV